MALPKEPRQKMINLMYLVLTALLALNVSSEILNAFKTVKQSLDTSTGVAYDKTNQLFRSFAKKMDDPATKENATIWHEKADKAHKLADEMYKFLAQMQKELIGEAKSNPSDPDSTYKIDDLEAATRLFIAGHEGKTPPKGKDLYNKLVNFKKDLLAIDTSIAAEFATSLPITMPATYGEGAHDWGNTYFHMTPTIAGLTILSKFQNDVRNSETQIVEFCHKKIGEVIFTYDEFKVIANISSSYMMPGEEFTISAGIGAYSSQAQPQVSVGGMGGAVKSPEGDYQVKGRAETAAGEYTRTVNITYLDQKTGQPKTVTRPIKYTVGQPAGLTLSTDKTRVFYTGGLENELSATGSGGDEKTQVEISGEGVTYTKAGGGKYIVKCANAGVATVKVTDLKNGKVLEVPIKIKNVPLPSIFVGNKSGGPAKLTEITGPGGLNAQLKDFIFEGVTYKVVQYDWGVSGPGSPEGGEGEEAVKGNAYSQKFRSIASKLESGAQVIFYNIKVANPQDPAAKPRPIDNQLVFFVD